MTLVCKSVGIWDGIVNPIYGCGVKIAPDNNPVYAGIESSYPMDSKMLLCLGKGSGIETTRCPSMME